MLRKKTKRSRTSSRRFTHVRVMFTCVGRRVELMQAFRRAAETLGIRLTLIGTDISSLGPAMHVVDRAVIVPPISRREYVSTLVDIAARHKADMIIPLIDHDLIKLSKATRRFADAGTTPLISSPQVVAICRDKIKTYEFLKSKGIDTPETWRWADVLKRKRHRFPYFMKPRMGSAAQGINKISNSDELRVLGKRVNDPIVQEFVAGVEHTLDVYAGFDGVPRCVVPRRRLEVRDGEVSKAVTVKDRRIIDAGLNVVESLAGCVGVVTIQCIVTRAGRIRVIEINPRFGGGAPLGIAAGADYPKWLLAEYLGDKPRIRVDGFKDRLHMFRYDQSVFIKSADGPLPTLNTYQT